MTITRKRITRVAFACIAVLTISACGSARYPAHYVLHFEPSPQASSAARGRGTLAIKELRCRDYLCDDRIVYRPTPAEVGFYEHHRWAARPGAMIADYVAERVRARSLFASVSGDEARTAADFVLSGTVERFEEVDADRGVTALCTVSAQVVDARTRSVVWSGTATERLPVDRRDVAGVVDGLANAVRSTVDRLVVDMELALAPDSVRRNVP
jgi:ABC-type uncharacterized transport system auxiliary subunit